MRPSNASWALVAAFLLTIAGIAAAADKSGVTANTISLPSGPGSIEGLGESFEPTLNTGTAKYRVGLKISPGTAGHAPALALDYDGGGSNGPLGLGWSLGVPFVQRQTDKGIPRYVDGADGVDNNHDGVVDDPGEIDVLINELGEELVPRDDGYWFCENEGAFIRYRREGDHWQARLPDGTLLEFGVTADARVTDALTGRVFRWLLERFTDTNGNTIHYSYHSYAHAYDLNQRYLHKIEYGPGGPPWAAFHFIVFEYERRPDWFEDARAGFLVRTGKRIREVVVGTQGAPAELLPGHAEGDFNADGTLDHLNRKYVLTYEAHSHHSLLTSVTWIGADNVSRLPPLALSYTIFEPPDPISAAGGILGALNAPFQVMDNDLVDLIDLNGDALPDILKTEGFFGLHTAFLNLGEDTSGTTIKWGPSTVVRGDTLVGNFNLASTNVHLADMNGDGLSDFVYKTLNDVYYFANQGNSSWGARSLMNLDPSDSAPPSPFGVQHVKTADLDFDKRMDIIQSVSVGGGADYRIWFNLGNQRYARSTTVAQTSGFMLSQTGVHIADFNGDRVPDILRVTPTGLQVTTGLGHGHFTEAIIVSLPDYTLDTAQVERARLHDINGDGLTDLVIERAAPGQLWYWINLGTYTLDNRRTITGMPTGLGVSPEIRWADMNGNGTDDLIYADSDTSPRIQTVDIGRLIGCEPRPNMLTAIDNGIGRKITIEYTTSTRFVLRDANQGHAWPDPLPFPLSVVAGATVNDSLGNQYHTEFTYHDGYYDAAEKEFRGFALVEKREIGDPTAPGLTMAYKFDTGASVEALKGKTLQVEVRNAQDQVFYREKNSWEMRTLLESANGDGRRVAFPFQREKTRHVIEKGNGDPVQLLWEYEYDDFGNLIRQVEHGRMDPGWDDERVTETSYTAGYPSGQEAWILRGVVQHTISNSGGRWAAQSRTYYDGSPVLGEVTKGNATKTEDWVAGDEYVISTRNDFDSFGNIRATYDPLYGSAPGHYRNLAYDSLFHTYPVEEAIFTGSSSLVLIFSAIYDVGLGIVLSSTEANGFTTVYEHDALGRVVAITRPHDRTHTVDYEYVLAHNLGGGRIVNWVETRQRDGSPGDGFLHARTFIDGLGRRLMTRSEGEVESEIIVTDVSQFNGRGGPWKRYLPFKEQGTLAYSEPAYDGPHTEHFYDATGREVRMNHPAIGGVTAFFTKTYAPLSTTVLDEEQTNPSSANYGSAIHKVEDGLENKEGDGRLREVHEIVKLSDSGEPLYLPVEWLTRYDYDLLNNLVALEDSQGNRKLAKYDGLSRRIEMNDPDRGIVRYKFDSASNLIETTDAKGQRITYTYDGVNRILSEDYDNGTDPSPDVAYFYDEPRAPIALGDGTHGTANNTRGFLATVQDLAGQEHTSYDERGRVEWVVRRVPDPKTSVSTSYKMEMTYDSMDRTEHLIYPDNDRVSYTYNPRGLLENIGGGASGSIVAKIDYTAAGQIEQIEFGNGILTEYFYDSRLRLVAHTSATNAASPLIEYGYTYDRASNIRRIDDLRTATAVPDGDPRRNNQTFDYDDLYRLTRVQYSFAPPGKANRSDGEISYRYDRIGNLVRKTSNIIHDETGLSVVNIGAMAYGGAAGPFGRIGRESGDSAGPHALTSTYNGHQQRAFTYDANGNMEDLNGKTSVWDFKDRLVSLETNELQAAYMYDYTNRRTTKFVERKSAVNDLATTSNVTVYPSRYFEVRNGEEIKYVYNRDTRVARITGQLDLTRARVQRIALRAGWNLFSLTVSAETGPGDDPAIDQVWLWDRTSRQFRPVVKGEQMAASTILWVRANAATTMAIKGTYTEPNKVAVSAAGDFVPILGSRALKLRQILPNGVRYAFAFDTENQRWLVHFEGLLSDDPEIIAPGEVIFLTSPVDSELQLPQAADRIRYYHQDHLGSSFVMANAAGELLQETVHYPFGFPRNIHNPALISEPYLFSQRERDLESGLIYFGQRYYNPVVGRWISPDPIGEAGGPNVYAYVDNDPMSYTDPTGLGKGKAIGWVVSRTSKAIIKRAPIFTEKQAARLFGKGMDVLVKGGRQRAQKVANLAIQKGRQLRHTGHLLRDQSGKVIGKGLSHIQDAAIAGRHIFYGGLGVTLATLPFVKDANASVQGPNIVADEIYSNEYPGKSVANYLTITHYAGEDSILSYLDWINPGELIAMGGDWGRSWDRERSKKLLQVAYTIRDGKTNLRTYAFDPSGELNSVSIWEGGEVVKTIPAEELFESLASSGGND